MSKTESHIHEGMAVVTDLRIKDGQPKEDTWSWPEPVTKISLDPEGARVGKIKDRHYGMMRKIRGYQIGDNRKGTEVFNDMQLSVCTKQDLQQIAELIGISKTIKESKHETVESFMAGALGVNIVIEAVGVKNEELKRYLGPGTKLIQGQDTSGSIVHISEANLPCHKPAEMMHRRLQLDQETKAFSESFIRQAIGYRGWVGSVYKPGELSVGDELAVQVAVETRQQAPPDWRSQAATKFWPRPAK